MVLVDDGFFDEGVQQLYIHFKVEDHFLKLETFIKTAESAQRVMAALDETFFQGSLDYELIVLPPEQGSFLSRLGLWVGGGITSLFAFANTEIGSTYIEALTGHPPTYWAKRVGQHNKETLEDLQEWIEGLPPEKLEKLQADEEPPAKGATSLRPADQEEACRVSARIVVEMTRGMLDLETVDLERMGVETGSLPDAMDARGDFYHACLDDAEVHGIGFTTEEDFPVPRNSFPERAVKPTRRERDDDPVPWLVSIESIYVTSPNWDKEDQRTRNWKGKDSIRRDCYFVVEDAEFWHHVRLKDLSVDVLDNLKVQWAFQEVNGRIRNRRVLRVLEFNGDKLADPLAPEAVRAILGDFSDAISQKDRPSLFDKES